MPRKVSITIYGLILFFALGAIGCIWEGLWWHEVVNNSLFGDPPNILFHICISIALILAIMMRYTQKKKEWVWFITALSLTLLSIPLRFAWEKNFGIPSRSGLIVYWGPVHILTSVGFVWGSCVLLTFLKNNHSIIHKAFLQAVLFAIIFITFVIRANPLRPTGLHELLGFWGPGATAFLLVTTLLYAQKFLESRCSAIFTVFAVLIFSVADSLLAYWTFVIHGLPLESLFHIFFGGNRHPPLWLNLLSFFGMALSIDLMKSLSFPRRGFLAGCVYAALLYGLTPYFLSADNGYTHTQALLATITGGFGGYLAGFLPFSRLSHEKIPQ